MKFKKENLQKLVYDDCDTLTQIREEQTGSGRWTVENEMVFRFEGHYYRADYSEGATEQQDVTAFECDNDLIECDEVWPESRSIVVFTDQDPDYTIEGAARMEVLLCNKQ